jgi:hypothetical protein
MESKCRTFPTVFDDTYIPYAELDDERMDMVEDESEFVRVMAAAQGYGLDKLVSDESSWVRMAIAFRACELDKLVDDEDYRVRYWVAYRGYGLDKLVNDKIWCVRSMAQAVASELQQTS